MARRSEARERLLEAKFESSVEDPGEFYVSVGNFRFSKKSREFGASMGNFAVI